MINKVGIQLYSDLVIFGMFLKSLYTSLGPRQSTSSVLAITDKSDDKRQHPYPVFLISFPFSFRPG